METKKTNLENSLDALIGKAEHCSDLADAQRESADKQHLSAHKLEKLSRSLIKDAEAIKDELTPASEVYSSD